MISQDCSLESGRGFMALASDHADFVSKFSKIVENSLKRNYADDTGTNSKRPRLKVIDKPLEVRFHLGSDDNTYLQAGIALLNDGSHESEATTVLAPTALYNSNLFDGIRKKVQESMVQKYSKALQDTKNELKNALEQTSFKGKNIEDPTLKGDIGQEIIVHRLGEDERVKGIEMRKDALVDRYKKIADREYFNLMYANQAAAKAMMEAAKAKAEKERAEAEKAIAIANAKSSSAEASSLMSRAQQELEEAKKAQEAAKKANQALRGANKQLEDKVKEMRQDTKELGDALQMTYGEALRMSGPLKEYIESKLRAKLKAARENLPDSRTILDWTESIIMGIADVASNSGEVFLREIQKQVLQKIYSDPDELQEAMKLHGLVSRNDDDTQSTTVDNAEAALVNRLFRSTDDGFRGYVAARGLIGSRGPHERALPGDEHLPYTVPRNIARTIERIKQARLPPPAQVPKVNEPSPEAVRAAVNALNGNLALDELEKCDDDDGPDVLVARPRQVRWLPEGPHGEDIAAAAALEHAHARCLRVADTDARLNDEAKWALRLIAGRLKTRQLKHMYRISRASQLDELPPTPSRDVLVTRPSAFVNGVVALPSDHTPLLASQLPSAPAKVTTGAIVKSVRTYRQHAVYDAPYTTSKEYESMPTGAGESNNALINVGPADEIQTGVLADPYVKAYCLIETIESIEKTLEGLQSDGTDDKCGDTNAETRRQALWNEALREMAISTDRVWTFVRTLSGMIGEPADTLLVPADDDTLRASQQLESQRREVAQRVTQFHAKLVEIVMNSLLKESKLKLSSNDKKLVVLDAEFERQINELTSGQSGRPFFEANVALKSMREHGGDRTQTLEETVDSISDVVNKLQEKLETQLVKPEVAGASLSQLAAPRNSFFVRLTDDTVAAIRTAFDRFSTEHKLRGGRHIFLWELVEGHDHVLSTRFAEFAGHILVLMRNTTGSSAMYASRTQLNVNAQFTGTSLGRLLNQAAAYNSCPPPSQSTNGREAYFKTAKPSDSVHWASSVAHTPMARSALVNRSGWGVWPRLGV